ncbi:MAG: UDP-N-acetylmuramoyl-L-alanine--D-glutamate ligase [Pseudomonadota bacterium]
MAQDLIASSNRRVVFGLGQTGLSCARLLYRRGLPFAVIDSREEPPGLATFRAEMPEVPVHLGTLPEDLLLDAHELVVSPGIALDEPAVAKAMDAGVTVVGDIDLFVREARAPILGITGSNAKSTVTALVGRMASLAQLNVGVGGNLGPPALDLLDEARQLYVVELSSFQLERAGRLGLDVASVLNISPDHLDRHGSMPRYHMAKHRIFRGCKAAVVNRDDPLTVPLVDASVKVVSWRMGEPELHGFGLRIEEGIESLCFGPQSLLPATEVRLPGRHNLANALAALAIGHAAGLPMVAMLQALREFGGLPHRCERVADIAGVHWVNDSKGTNPGATRAALEGLGGDSDLVLIAGGVAKGADFSGLRPAIAKHCKAVLLIGEATESMEAAFAGAANLERCASLEVAIERAAELADAGDTVLLSPACASFDMFSNYVQRGDAFRNAVAGLTGSGDE